MRIKKLMLGLFLVLAITACKETNDNNVLLFNNVFLKTADGEKMLKITRIINDQYQSHLQNVPYQAPLFKCIQAPHYTIFVGLPYQTTLSQFFSNIDSSFIIKTDSISYLYTQQEIKGIILSKYVVDCNKNLILVLAETDQKEIADSLFNYTNFSSRINIQQ